MVWMKSRPYIATNSRNYWKCFTDYPTMGMWTSHQTKKKIEKFVTQVYKTDERDVKIPFHALLLLLDNNGDSLLESFWLTLFFEMM